ncbi:FMN-linked oxidoreductase [Lactarius vividus]|nr:FMN-linked oxidoreductase [Lactarius vividus]
MSNRHDSSQSALRPVTLPSGQVMSNALVKAAMYEHMASLFGGLPNANHFALYSLWSQGGWGMIMTGNVQVSQDHLTLGRDMVVPKTVTSDALRSYTALASAMRPASEQYNQESHDLSHAGRQSPIVLGGRLPLTPPFAPSALRIGRNEQSSAHLSWFARLVYKIGFQTPRAMSVQDIDHLVDRFVLSAKLAHDAGFDGVELHASHGCKCPRLSYPQLEVNGRFADLLAHNIRDDAYGAPLHLLQRIVSSIRKVLPRPFVLGIKLSSSDYVGAGSLYNAQAEEEAKNRALAHVVDIARWDMVDFIEISGGDYENPEFMTSRQAFFARFARKARDAIHAQVSSSPRHPLVLLTGGMRSPEVFEDALSQGHADLVGIGRASVIAPRLPLLLRKQPTLSYSDTPLIRAAVSVLRWLGVLPLPTLIGAGAAVAWYVVTMSRTSRGSGINYQMGGIRVILTMWIPELRAIAPLFSCCLAICFYSRFQWW